MKIFVILGQILISCVHIFNEYLLFKCALTWVINWRHCYVAGLSIKRKFVHIHCAGADNFMVVLHCHISIMSNIQKWVQWSIFLLRTETLQVKWVCIKANLHTSYILDFPCNTYNSSQCYTVNKTRYFFQNHQLSIMCVLYQLRKKNRFIICIYSRLKNIEVWFPKHLFW